MSNFSIPNGFYSWVRTHHEVVMLISTEHASKMEAIRTSKYHSGDRMTFIDYAIDWTNEFEKKNKDRQWDGEFLEEIEQFVEQQVQILHNTYCI